MKYRFNRSTHQRFELCASARTAYFSSTKCRSELLLLDIQPCRARSRNTNFCSLPVEVRGSVSNTTVRGTL